MDVAIYIVLMALGSTFIILSFIEKTKHPLFALLAMVIFALETISSFGITYTIVYYDSVNNTAKLIQVSYAETPLALLCLALALVGMFQFYALTFRKVEEAVREELVR
ncbi:hypothetical protein [Archaeoglobus sp.]